MPVNSLVAGAMPQATAPDAGPPTDPAQQPTGATDPTAAADAMGQEGMDQDGMEGMDQEPTDDGRTVDIGEVYTMAKKQAAIEAKLRSLLEEGGPIARKKVAQAAVELVAARVVSAQVMAGFLADLPEDPQEVREWVEKNAEEAEDQLEQLLVMLEGVESPLTPMSAFGEGMSQEEFMETPAGGTMGGGPADTTGATPAMTPGMNRQVQ